jgi:hypothetical protein
MGAAVDLDLDAPVARGAHALGIFDGERGRGVVVAARQHEIDRPSVGGRIAVLGGGAGTDRDVQVEQMVEAAAPAPAGGDRGC